MLIHAKENTQASNQVDRFRDRTTAKVLEDELFIRNYTLYSQQTFWQNMAVLEASKAPY